MVSVHEFLLSLAVSGSLGDGLRFALLRIISQRPRVSGVACYGCLRRGLRRFLPEELDTVPQDVDRCGLRWRRDFSRRLENNAAAESCRSLRAPGIDSIFLCSFPRLRHFPDLALAESRVHDFI